MQHAPYYPAQGPSAAGLPADIVQKIKSAAGPTVVLLGMRAALPLVRFVFWRVYAVVSPMPSKLMGDNPEHMAMLDRRKLLGSVFDGLGSLLTVVALIAFFVWFARVYGWIRATRGGTRFSTGLAIGGWFIPFANFVLPYMAVRDAVRRGANDEGGGLVPIWWAGFLIAMVLENVQAVARSTPNVLSGLPQIARDVIYYGGMASQVVAYGALLLIVKGLTRKAAG